MILKTKPTFKELLLGTVATISLIGLLSLAYQDKESRDVFLNTAAFIVGTVIGHLIPGQK